MGWWLGGAWRRQPAAALGLAFVAAGMPLLPVAGEAVAVPVRLWLGVRIFYRVGLR